MFQNPIEIPQHFTSGLHRSFGVPAERDDKAAVTLDILDAYAVERWEVGPVLELPARTDLLLRFRPYYTIWYRLGQVGLRPDHLQACYSCSHAVA